MQANALNDSSSGPYDAEVLSRKLAEHGDVRSALGAYSCSRSQQLQLMQRLAQGLPS
jgi:hypothetical protein